MSVCIEPGNDTESFRRTEEALCQSRDEWKALAIAKHARVKELERALKHIQKEAYNGNTDRCWATARAALSGKQ